MWCLKRWYLKGLRLSEKLLRHYKEVLKWKFDLFFPFRPGFGQEGLTHTFIQWVILKRVTTPLIPTHYLLSWLFLEFFSVFDVEMTFHFSFSWMQWTLEQFLAMLWQKRDLQVVCLIVSVCFSFYKLFLKQLAGSVSLIWRNYEKNDVGLSY